MKKTNKKGFTLAELLIVIAIIAVLIAIAIPTFSGALRNARLQTDHANIRSAYAMAMTANMMGGVDYNGTFEATPDSSAPTYYFQKDGSLFKSGDSGTNTPYELQVEAKNDGTTDECTASVGCQQSTPATHKKGNVISIQYKAKTAGGSDYEWQVVLTTHP